jgi:hypothetical protein
MNQAVNTPLIRHIEGRNGVAYDGKEINRVTGLGVRDDPILEAMPSSSRRRI